MQACTILGPGVRTGQDIDIRWLNQNGSGLRTQITSLGRSYHLLSHA